MGNQCPCLHPKDKTASHYALLEEKNNGTIISESNESKDNIKPDAKGNNVAINGVNSFGPPTMPSNPMGGNSPNFKSSFEDDINEQMKSSSVNVEIFIKNEGEVEDKDFKKKVRLEDFNILKVSIFILLFLKFISTGFGKRSFRKGRSGRAERQ